MMPVLEPVGVVGVVGVAGTELEVSIGGTWGTGTTCGVDDDDDDDDDEAFLGGFTGDAFFARFRSCPNFDT